MRSLTIFVMTLCVVIGCAADSRQEYGPAAAIDSVMSVALETGPFVGASVSVAERGELAFVGSYGLADLERGAPVTSDTRFNIASVGKVVAATAIMRLVEEGLVRLEDPVVDLLPELRDAIPVQGVQVRHLLNMTSGLPDYVASDLVRWEATRAPLEPEFVLEHVRGKQRVFEPGSEWMYSNTGFYLTGLIVERITGMPWGEFITQDVLDALELSQTGLCDEAGGDRSVGYQVSDSGFVRSIQDQETGLRGDGGLCATTSEVALLPARLREGLLPESFREMVSPTRLANGATVDYGHGVARGWIFDRDLWGHLGGAGSLVSVLLHFDAEDTSIALAVNTRDASFGALVLVAEVARAVLARVGAAPEPGVVPDGLLSQLAGTYVGDRSRTTYVFTVEDDVLTRSQPGVAASGLGLRWAGDLDFGREDWPYDRFRFHIVDQQVVGFSAYYNGFFDGYYARRN